MEPRVLRYFLAEAREENITSSIAWGKRSGFAFIAVK